MPRGAIGHPRRHREDFVGFGVDFGVHIGTLLETFFALVGFFFPVVFWHGSGHHVLSILVGFRAHFGGHFCDFFWILGFCDFNDPSAAIASVLRVGGGRF